MNVNMPQIADQEYARLDTGKLYLARFNSRGVVETVYDTGSEVITIAPDGDIETVSHEFFEDRYTIIRPFAPGESLTLIAE